MSMKMECVITQVLYINFHDLNTRNRSSLESLKERRVTIVSIQINEIELKYGSAMTSSALLSSPSLGCIDACSPKISFFSHYIFYIIF